MAMLMPTMTFTQDFIGFNILLLLLELPLWGGGTSLLLFSKRIDELCTSPGFTHQLYALKLTLSTLTQAPAGHTSLCSNCVLSPPRL